MWLFDCFLSLYDFRSKDSYYGHRALVSKSLSRNPLRVNSVMIYEDNDDNDDDNDDDDQDDDDDDDAHVGGWG